MQPAPTHPGRRPDERWALAAAVAVYTISAALPMALLDAGPILCPLRRLTGLPCPGCGLTHAFVSLGHGDIAAALRFNALSLMLFPLGLLWIGWRLSGRSTPSWLSKRQTAFLGWFSLLAVIAFGVYRLAVPAARPF